jgi:hypothetical protein
MKPRVFIGSSKEALPIAEHVKNKLSTDFECKIWTDDIFAFNDNYLETLMKAANLFDFGIMIFSKDDFTKSRNVQFEAPRDNVVFEFGLFLGRLGNLRAFVLKEKEVKLPSDLLGITIAEFEKGTDVTTSITLNDQIEKLRRHLNEKYEIGVLGLLPSTALAIGYFHNFVQNVCSTLASSTVLTVNQTDYSDFKFRIIMPKDLNSDIKVKADVYYKKNKLEHYPLPSNSRSYPLFVTVDPNNTTTLLLNDMPTTLSGIDKAIEMYIRKGHIGRTQEEKLLEEREIRNFRRVLELLIQTDTYCIEYAEIVDEV